MKASARRERGDAAVLGIASMLGVVSLPDNSVYAATKTGLGRSGEAPDGGGDTAMTGPLLPLAHPRSMLDDDLAAAGKPTVTQP